MTDQNNKELSSSELKGVSGGTGQQDREFKRMNAKQKKHVKHNVEGLTPEEAIAGKKNRDGLLKPEEDIVINDVWCWLYDAYS